VSTMTSEYAAQAPISTAPVGELDRLARDLFAADPRDLEVLAAQRAATEREAPGSDPRAIGTVVLTVRVRC